MVVVWCCIRALHSPLALRCVTTRTPLSRPLCRPIAPRANGAVSGVFRAVVVANGVRKLSRDIGALTFSESDYDAITVRGALLLVGRGSGR